MLRVSVEHKKPPVEWSLLEGNPIQTLKDKLEFYSVPEPNSGCWLWIGSKLNKGHGCLKVGDKTMLAHRASWEVHKGAIPNGLWVLHLCNNACCINPSHLTLGTHQENMAYMVTSGRSRQIGKNGSANHHAKLTEENVRYIRKSLKEKTKTRRQLSNEFEVTYQLIRHIEMRRGWSHLND